MQASAERSEARLVGAALAHEADHQLGNHGHEALQKVDVDPDRLVGDGGE